MLRIPANASVENEPDNQPGIKPLSPEVTRRHQFRKTHLKGSIPVARSIPRDTEIANRPNARCERRRAGRDMLVGHY
jgi:hypothetical protein